ncbi:hypothetical protein Ancab_023344 [Ancistrocladus abbreviatus]
MVELGCILFESCDPTTFPAALFYSYARWAWKRCLYTASHDSENWELASAKEFQPMPRLCRCILVVYEDDLRNPIWAPPGGYHMNPNWVIFRKDYEETHGQSTPYMIYLDHEKADIVLAIRGLHLGNRSDCAILFDNKLGQTTFNGRYVHNGQLSAARWVFDAEHEVLKGFAREESNLYTDICWAFTWGWSCGLVNYGGVIES